MNYSTTEIKHQLAARYVIGSMRGSARKRFQRLLMTIPSLRNEVAFWEEHLYALTDTVPERQAPERIWKSVEQRLGWLPKDPVKTSWWSWGFRLAAALLLINLLVISPDEPQKVQAFERVAVIQNDDAQTLWLIQQNQQTLSVRAVGNIELRAENDYELWMLPQSGSAPISLGLLPQQGVRSLTIAATINLNDVAALAVSREPLGGSPLAVPSGPVVYTTDLVEL
ncbi:anti-sigma factor domain-containing protein [Pseudidiomarina sp.]|uniref:anti-sigma factor n=1 Tax=Pseudidiomarina sp. TaxID=2081707 RepID=UPI003A96DAE7